jgi:hypothetical protein
MRDAAAKRETTMRERLGDVLRPMITFLVCEACSCWLNKMGLSVYRRVGAPCRASLYTYMLSIEVTPFLANTTAGPPCPQATKKTTGLFLPDLVRAKDHLRVSSLGNATFIPTLPILPTLP